MPDDQGHIARLPAVAALLLASVALCCPSCRSVRESPAVRIGDHQWRVELATTDHTRQRGLGGRDGIPPGTGMLFVFPRAEVAKFHMLNCRVPLDIAFIRSDLVVVNTRTMPVETDPAHPAHLYYSQEAVTYVLEVGAGELAKAGVKPGDRVALVGAAREAAKEAR